MALNPFGVAGIPGGVGGTTLGLGIVMSLHDMFSKQATRVERRLIGLDRTTSVVAGRMSRNLGMLNVAIGGLAASAIGLATMSFPIRSAMKFEDAITRVAVVVKNTVSKSRLEEMSLNLAAMFPQDPTEMAEGLGTIVKAGIDNVDKAYELTRVSNQLAIATGGDLNRVVEGMTSIVNAYQVGLDDAVYSTEDAAKRFEGVASMLFEAMKFGKFSDVSGIEDIEAMMRQFGQIAPTMAGMNVSVEEFLSTWAVATLGGQNARRSATGIRQMLMDVQNRTREPASMENFIGWTKEQGIDIPDGTNLSRLVQEQGLTNFLNIIRDYATISDPEQLGKMMETSNYQSRWGELVQSLPEDMSFQEAMQSDEGFAKLVEEGANMGLDLSRLNEVFRSIWGVTAAIPLVGVQNERLNELIERLRNAADSDEIKRAFEEFYRTGKYQFDRMISLFENISINLGKSVLKELTNFLMVFNQVLIAIQDFLQGSQEIVGVFMRIAASTFIFTGVLSAILAGRAGLNLFNLGMQQMMSQFMVFPRLARFGMLLTFRDITLAMTLMVGAMLALRKAWEANFGGIQEFVTGVWTRVKLLYDTMVTLFERVNSEGRSFLFMDEWTALGEYGLQGFAVKLFAFLWRAKAAWEGLLAGFRGFYNDIFRIFQTLYDSTLKPILHYFGLAEDFMDRLMVPGKENVEMWRQIGTAIGYAVGLLLTVSGTARILSFLGRLAFTLMNLRPFLLLVGGLAAAIAGLRRVGFGDLAGSLDETLGSGNLLSKFLMTMERFQLAIPNLGSIYKSRGWSGVGSLLGWAIGLNPEQRAELVRKLQEVVPLVKGRIADMYADLKGRGVAFWAYITSPDRLAEFQSLFATIGAWFGRTFNNEEWAGVWSKALEVIDQLGTTLYSIFQTVAYWVEKAFSGDGGGLIMFLEQTLNLADNLLVTIDEIMKLFRGEQTIGETTGNIFSQWVQNPAALPLMLLSLFSFGPAIVRSLATLLWRGLMLPGLRRLGVLMLANARAWGELLLSGFRWVFNARNFGRLFAIFRWPKQALDLLGRTIAGFITRMEPLWAKLGPAVWRRFGGAIQKYVVAVIKAVGWFFDLIPRIGNEIVSIFYRLEPLWGRFGAGIVRFVRTAGAWISRFRWMLLVRLTNPWVAALATIVTAGAWLWQNWDTIADRLGPILDRIKSAFTDMRESVRESIAGALSGSWLEEKINDVLMVVNRALSLHNNLPMDWMKYRQQDIPLIPLLGSVTANNSDAGAAVEEFRAPVGSNATAWEPSGADLSNASSLDSRLLNHGLFQRLYENLSSDGEVDQADRDRLADLLEEIANRDETINVQVDGQTMLRVLRRAEQRSGQVGRPVWSGAQ